jgi:hypothetical protein
VANVTYTDQYVTGSREIFTNNADRRTLRDLSSMDTRTVADLGRTREQASWNFGTTVEILAHRETGDPQYRGIWK